MTQLLFFDTFSHDMEEELNLDLVQFPSSVIVEEVRVIPLGARVQANFPGGMRLGATVPVRFNLELFVNDLTNPGASTFTSLGSLAYDENGQIFLNTGPKKILTDGLILRGCYSTITLAVYGLLSPTTTEQLAAMAASAKPEPTPVVVVDVPRPPVVVQPPSVIRDGSEWNHRVQTATAWPPPVPDNAVPVRGVSAAHQESYHQRGDWISENGKRDAYFDHHHSKRRSIERQSRSPHRSSYPSRGFRSPRDYRSPQRDHRSRTRSRSRSNPPLPPVSRRSITPKSPTTSNGHLSPMGPHNYKRRSVSLEKVKEEAPILDDVSDISDGDIPVDDDEGGHAKNEEDHLDGLDNESSHHNNSAHLDEDDASSYDKHAHHLADIPEDIEEISDAEAEWSDDGDCFFGENLADFEVDFGQDWTDPFRTFSPESHSIVPLKYYRLFPANNYVSVKSCETTSNEMLEKLEELNDQEVLGSDWVELVEAFTAKLLPTRRLIRSILRGLSTSDALKQPVHTFKVRHLKSSLKFTIAAMEHDIEWTTNDYQEILAKLMDILSDSSVAVPLKIMSLAALNRTLDHSLGMSVFLQTELLSNLTEMLVTQKLTSRLKVGLAALLERFALKEAVEALKSAEAHAHHEKMALLHHVLSFVRNDTSPKLSFLSNEKCGVVPCAFRDLFNANLLHNVLASCQQNVDDKNREELFMTVEAVLKEFTRTHEGLLLLASFPSETEQILKLISSTVNVDFELFCLHTLLRIDALSSYGVNDESPRGALERMEVLESLQELYGMTFSTMGRTALVHVLSLNEFLKPIVRLVKHSSDDAGVKKESPSSEEEPVLKKDMKKSAIRGYACELLLLVVRTSDEVEYLKFFTEELLAIGKSDETSKLFELISWLNFLDGRTPTIWTSDAKVQPSAMEFFCESVKKNLENISPLSCELVMSIRFLHKLLCGQGSDPSNLISAFSNDLCEFGVAILTKVCGYHEQPHLHTATFAGYNGHLLVATIRPIVQILKLIASHIILCLDDGFRDTTAIQTMLKTFALCTVVSTNSACYASSLEICADIVEFLMCFTSVSVDMSLGKTTTWQLMIQDVLKYVLTSPHTYLPGLKILSQILPLPFKNTTTTEAQRNLWSAQLYGMEGLLKEMVTLLIPCRVSLVQKWLRRVCQQLSDLSAPIAAIVAEAVADALKAEPEKSSKFASILLKLPSLRAAFLSLMRGDKYSDLVKTLPAEVVANVAQSLTDLRVSLSPDSSDLQSISNALPDKESCHFLVNTLIAHCCNSSGKPHLTLARTINGLSKHLCGLSVIRTCFLHNKSEVAKILKEMDVDEMTLMGESLLALSKFIGIEDLRELLDWTGNNSGDTEHYLYSDDLGQSSVVKKLVAFVQRDPPSIRLEELDFDWPSAEPLLEQFAKRKAAAYFDDSDAPIEQAEDAVESEEDLLGLVETYLPDDFDIQLQVKQVCDEKSLERERQLKKKAVKKSLLEAKVLANKSLISSFKAGGNVAIRGSRSVFNRGPGGQRPDLFRSRPPNTSRPPSLHVDDFLVLQSRGQQPTGPTGYNKQSLKAAQELFAEKEAKSKGSIVGYREATKEPVFDKSNSSANVSNSNLGSISKGRSERANAGAKGYRGNSGGSNGNGRTSFNNRERHGGSSSVSNSGGGRGWSPSSVGAASASGPGANAGRDYGRGEGRSAGGGRPPLPNDRRYSNSRRNGGDSRRGGKDRNKGNKSRIAEGSRNVR